MKILHLINTTGSVPGNYIGSVHTGTEYATSEDALQAAYAFAEQSAAAKALAEGEAAFQSLLTAVAQAWNVTSTMLATSGTICPLSGNEVIVAGAGSETVTDSSSPNTYCILSGANLTINNFHTGSNGSRLDFLSSGGTATVSTSGNNVIITVGSSTVTLTNVALSAFSITDNLTGVGSLNISGVTNQSQLSAPASLADIGASQTRSISGVTAADASSVAGQVFRVGVSDTAANVVANLAALQALAANGQFISNYFD